MQPRILKYILDIESIIEEIESIKQKTHNDFRVFSDDIILQRAVERDLEIIGEAIRKMIEINPTLHLYCLFRSVLEGFFWFGYTYPMPAAGRLPRMDQGFKIGRWRLR